MFCMTSPDTGASTPGVSLHFFSFEPLFYHCGSVTPGENYLNKKIEIKILDSCQANTCPSRILSRKNPSLWSPEPYLN